MKKLLFLLLCLKASLTAESLAPCSPPPCEKECAIPRLGISIEYDQMSEDFTPELVLSYGWLITGIALNYGSIKTSEGVSWHITTAAAIIGYQAKLLNALTGSIGATGSFGFLGGHYSEAGIEKEPLTIGPYFGLAYSPCEKIELYGRILPYSYKRTLEGAKKQQAFQEGQLGITWYFY
jgi:hypothetical protein